MLKLYKIGELIYQYEEGHQPDGAVEVKAVKPANKAVKPANKTAKAAKK